MQIFFFFFTFANSSIHSLVHSNSTASSLQTSLRQKFAMKSVNFTSDADTLAFSRPLVLPSPRPASPASQPDCPWLAFLPTQPAAWPKRSKVAQKPPSPLSLLVATDNANPILPATSFSLCPDLGWGAQGRSVGLSVA